MIHKVNLNNHSKFMKRIYKSFCFKAPVVRCLKLAVDCNAAVERELSLVQNRPLCAGVISRNGYWVRQMRQPPRVPPFLVVEGPPFKDAVCSSRLFCGILKWALGLNNSGSDN